VLIPYDIISNNQNKHLQQFDAKIPTEDNACHGSGEKKLLLEVLGSERNAAVDENSIESAV